MKKTSFLLLALIPLFAYAQKKGVRFDTGLSWTEIREKAKAENKFIFIHCYTSNCGPSSYMNTAIYPTEEAGNFMNDKFISIKLQIDRSNEDNERVRSQYQYADEIIKQYNVTASPTYLIFDRDGRPLHRYAGQLQTTEEFIEKIKTAFNPSSQYFVMLDEYKAGKKDTAFLHSLAKAVIAAYDMTNITSIVNDYLNTQQDLFIPENLALLGWVTHTSRDRGFPIMLNYPDKVNEVMGKGYAEKMSYHIIVAEEIHERYKGEEPDWDAITAVLTKKYPDRAAEIIAMAKFSFYRYKKDWENFQFAIVRYMKDYEARVSPEDANNYAWMVFENCNNSTCLVEASKWSKRSFKDNNNPGFIDTYANILYKLGKRKKAIEWEKKAMSLVFGPDKKAFEETIEKMKKGVKTWN